MTAGQSLWMVAMRGSHGVVLAEGVLLWLWIE